MAAAAAGIGATSVSTIEGHLKAGRQFGKVTTTSCFPSSTTSDSMAGLLLHVDPPPPSSQQPPIGGGPVVQTGLTSSNHLPSVVVPTYSSSGIYKMNQKDPDPISNEKSYLRHSIP